MIIRPATGDDARFLEDMLVTAANWDPDRADLTRAAVLDEPAYRHYVEAWPRPGDAGVVAEDDQGRPLGAAWFGFFDADDPGYGFVAADIPEVAVGVVPDARGKGIGAALLAELAEVAAERGVRSLSLSVELSNPARELYARCGYREVARASQAVTMVRDIGRRSG